MEQSEIKNCIEAALMSAAEPLAADRLLQMFDGRLQLDKKAIRDTIKLLEEDYKNRAIELVKVASGYRFQVSQQYAPQIQKLSKEKPAHYSRALLETLALIAYRQPVTRGEVEEVRGVAVSSHIIKTLLEREWIKVLGHKDVPGKPALFGTTKAFLDHFNLTSLNELPSLSELRDLDQIAKENNIHLEVAEPEDANKETTTEIFNSNEPNDAHSETEIDDVADEIKSEMKVESEDEWGDLDEEVAEVNALLVSEVMSEEANEA